MNTPVPHRTPRKQHNWSARAAAITLTAALFLSACSSAAPAQLPTATPYGPAPTAADVIATATTNAPATAAVEARSTKAATGDTNTSAPAAPSGDRMFAKMSAAERNGAMKEPPPMSIDPTKKYIATLVMAKGDRFAGALGRADAGRQ